MPKIRKFKLNINPYFITRRIKSNKLNVDENVNIQVPVVTDKIKRLFNPIMIFSTLKKDDFNRAFNTQNFPPEHKKWTAVSLVAYTVGDSTVNETVKTAVKENLSLAEKDTDSITLFYLTEAMDSAAGLVTRLLTEEAKKESCIIQDRYDLNLPEWREVLPLSNRILSIDQTLIPISTASLLRNELIGWVYRRKK